MPKRSFIIKLSSILLVICTLTACSVPCPGDISDPSESTEQEQSVTETTDGFFYPAKLTKSGSDMDEAITLTGEIKSSAGKIFILCEGEGNRLEALLDIDSDGYPERLALSCHGVGEDTPVFQEEGVVTASSGEVWLWAGGQAQHVQNGSAVTLWRLLALCPDGKQILFGYQYLSGEDGFVNTELYGYIDGKMTCVFCEEADLMNEDTVVAANTITAVSRMRIALCGYSNDYLFTWALGSDGTYQRQYEDVYEFLYEKKVNVSKQLNVYAEPDQNSETSVLKPQETVFLKTDLGAQREIYYDPAASITGSMLKGVTWMYLRGMDGTEGWIPISDGIYDTEGNGWMWYEVFSVVE